MDPLRTLRERVAASGLQQRCPGVGAVLTHIEHAESLFREAGEAHESQYLTDVVYRANHAFEGMLREAYTLFTGGDSAGETIQSVESALLRQKVFEPRVIELFKNYRQNWRNPSTHDHTLFFSNVEAFLAVLNVSSFAYVLAEQMIERIAFTDTRASVVDGTGMTDTVRAATPIDMLCNTLTVALNQARGELTKVGALESQLLGVVHAVLSRIEGVSEPILHPLMNRRLRGFRPDLLAKFEGERFILDVKQGHGPVEFWIEQSERYLRGLDVKLVVLLLFQADHPFGYLTSEVAGTGGHMGIIASEPAIDLVKRGYGKLSTA